MAVVVHNKSSAYDPVHRSFVNIRTGAPRMELAMSDPAAYLASTSGQNGDQYVAFSREQIEDLRKQRDRLKEDPRVSDDLIPTILGHQVGPSVLAAGILDHLDDEDVAIDRDHIVESIGNRFILQRMASDMAETEEIMNLPDVVRLSTSDRQSHQVAFDTARRLGLSDVAYIENFPMAIVNVGFKRARSIEQISDSDLVLHPPDRRTGRFQVFAETYTTEAILFKLDRVKAISWAERWTGTNLEPLDGLPEDIPLFKSIVEHDVDLRDCDEQRGETGSVLDPIGHNVMTLLHTWSHAAILACSIKSGFHTNSISEYLMPGSLSFAIYISKQYEKGLGGLHHLFTSDINGILRRIESNTQDCLHDPHCRNRTDSACHACINISETSCRLYNSHLDRKTLHGGFVGGSQRIGYIRF